MASLILDKNGGAVVRIRTPDGRRFPVRLGRLAKSRAQKIASHIAELEQCGKTGVEPDSSTRAWLEGVDGELRDRLVRAGFCDNAANYRHVGLGDFADIWIAWKSATVKESTVTRIKQAKRLLIEFFGDRKVASLTPGDGDDFRAWMIGKRTRPLAEATARKRASDVRDMFDYARRKGAFDGDNPFSHLPTAPVGNRSRQQYVSEEDARKVLAELQGAGRLTTTQLRLVFVLSRWGGLRVPSEPQQLKWADIDWARGRIRVRSVKTEHLQGHEFRELPLFPELEQPLQDAFDSAESGAVYVVPYLQQRNWQGARRLMLAAMERAGVSPWPKLWHQMRASRQTDLADRFPAHVVCGWLGNSKDVADRHYHQTTEAHYERAREEVVRKAVRSGGAGGGKGQVKSPATAPEGHSGAGEGQTVARPGLEPGTPAFSMPCSTN